MAAEPAARPRSKHLTIGTVCKLLREEFDDISISKIRFLEDQRLIAPRRTQGGYRLYSEEDVERLRTILRMQRDEFLPLRVIREELSAQAARQPGSKRRRGRIAGAGEKGHTFEELLTETDADARFVRELEEYGLLEGSRTGKEAPYTPDDLDIVVLCQRLGRYGVEARHLRAFRSAVGREAGLLEQILAPALRSTNPDRRQAGLEELETLAELTSDLTHLLLVRDLRDLARSAGRGL
jgi:DNA-binding transcriptional MerR regulator